MTQKLLIKGRHAHAGTFGMPKYTSELIPRRDYATLRLDDENHLDFWMEIDIPRSVLVQLLSDMDKEEDGERNPE